MKRSLAGQRDPTPPGNAVLTVTQLSQALRRAVTQAFRGPVTVRGEIANLSRQPSGHMYLSLRDPTSAVRCVMFKSAVQMLRFAPENGVEVETREVNLRPGESQTVCFAVPPTNETSTATWSAWKASRTTPSPRTTKA